MKLEIEIDDAIYNRYQEMLSKMGLDLQTFIQRIITEAIIRWGADPEACFKDLEVTRTLPTFIDARQRIFRPKES